MKQKYLVICELCNGEKRIDGYFTAKYYQLCDKCVKERDMKIRCKRHKGNGKSRTCDFCRIEGRF